MLEHAVHSIGDPLAVKRFPVSILLALVAAGVLAGVLLALFRPQLFVGRPPIRTITLSMKDYAFNRNNPTLVLRPGERVMFVVRNDEDTPVRHNFEIPALGVPPGKELEPGESREVTITAPLTGVYTYRCTTHGGMEGTIIIGRP
jgi:plastocyanin